MRKPPSPADRVLAPVAGVTAAQVQHAHEYGIVEPGRTFPGRTHGSGSGSSWDPDAARVIRRFYELVRLSGAKWAATLFLFVEGETVNERGLKRALRQWVGPAEDTNEHPMTRAERDANGFKHSRSELDKQLLTVMGLDRPEAAHALRDIAAASYGYPALLDARHRSTPLLVKAFKAFGAEEVWSKDRRGTAHVMNRRMAKARREDLLRIIDRATQVDFETARDRWGTTRCDLDEVKPAIRKGMAALLAGALIARTADASFDREAMTGT